MSNRVQIIFDAVNRTEQAVKTIESDVKGLGGVVSGVSKAFVALGGVIGTLAVARFAGDLLDVQIALDRIHNALTAATGSAEAAEVEFGFVRSEVKRLGLDLEAAAGGFSQLAAAARGTGVSGEQVREIFTAISEASTVMGLSAADTNGAIRALYQVMSKGTVQAEELRGQLGERIPGAFNIAARAMGVTTSQLNKMLEQGQLLSADFLPKFAAQLRREFADALPTALQSTQVSVNRLHTAWFELKAGLDQSGFGAAARDGIDALAGAIDRLRKAIKSTKAEDLQALQLELQNTLEQMTAREGYPEWMQKFWGDLEGHADELREKIAALKKEMKTGEPGGSEGGGGGSGKKALTKEEAEKLRKALAGLQLDVKKTGLNQFDAKIADINAKAAELTRQFGELGEIETWRKTRIGAIETDRELAKLKTTAAGLEESISGVTAEFSLFVQDLSLTPDVMTDITSGLKLFDKDMQETADKVGVSFEDMENAVEGWGSNFSAQLTDAVWAADVSFASIAESFGRMLTQMVLQKTVVEPLLGGGLNFLGGLFGAGSAAPTGGTFTSSIDASHFSLAPAHHAGGKFVAPMFHAGGLAGDEGFAVLKKGEVVFDPDQTKLVEGLSKLGNAGRQQPIVNIIGAPSTPQVRPSAEGNGVDVIFEQIETRLGARVAEGRGPLARAVTGSGNLNPARSRF